MTGFHIALYRTPPVIAPGLIVTGFGQHQVRHRIKERRLPVHALVLIESGNGRLKTEKAGLQDVNGPSLFWLPAGRRHSYGPLEDQVWSERWVLFAGSLVDDFTRARLLSEASPLLPLRNLGEMQRLFAALHAELAEDSTLSAMSAAATLHRIIVQAARQAEPVHPTPEKIVVDQLLQAVHDRAFEAIDMTALAAEFSMSPATLRRKFIEATGLPPKAFQLRLRIDRSKELLTLSDLSIESIAASVGISDPFYFSRLFADREHCSPSEFRSRHRRA